MALGPEQNRGRSGVPATTTYTQVLRVAAGDTVDMVAASLAATSGCSTNYSSYYFYSYLRNNYAG